MAKSLFENLTKWQNYAHYLLLSGAVFGIHYLTDVLGVEAAAVNGGALQWTGLFLFYAAGLFVADTIIHALFAIAPKPIQWRD